MKYSIVTPVYNNEHIYRAVMSVAHQGHDDFEHVIVNDGCTDGTMDSIISFWRSGKVKIVNLQPNQQRVIARNEGMFAARGEWICWLDADDFYFPYYLNVMDDMIEKYPDYKVFNFGGIVCWSHWDNALRLSKSYGIGDIFRSGDIMSGGFMFKKECLDEVGYLPEARDPFSFGKLLLDKFPEVKPLYSPGQTDLGNPWGDDWAMFYMLTRKFASKFVNVTPYMVMVRGEHKL